MPVQQRPQRLPLQPPVPPPYRAPPTPLPPFSKLNISEPNIGIESNAPRNKSPNINSAYRHTINHDNSHAVQYGLKNMLQDQKSGSSKHATMDGTTQNAALQQLRNHLSSEQQRNKMNSETYGGPDNHRDITQRGSLSRNEDDPGIKRLSYNNISFRKATQELNKQKIPPQVPPKPRSREQSRDDIEADNLEAELKHILREGSGKNINLGINTPPLPALSPESSPNLPTKNAKRCQMLEAHRAKKPPISKNEDVNSVTTTGLDLESVMGLQTDLTSDDDDDLSTTNLDMGDAQAIRKQLDSLEGMYSEVLKMLGLRKFGRTDGKLNNRRGGKLYGSMSSLPSVSSIGSRHLYHSSKDGKRGRDGISSKRGGGTSRESKTANKRFQRLESHVVTLARSVAHLSSEMRAQQIIMQQELESLRNDVQLLRHNNHLHRSNNPFIPPHLRSKVSPVHANRVKKLTKFFGDEPPLLRLFLKNLGYEKYASVFEDSKIGLLELPYLSEERLEKLGIPMGPRMRILQEAKSSISREPNYSVYIL